MQSDTRRVMIVDDDETNLKLMELALSQEKKYQLICAQNATDAITLIHEWEPELVLMDYSLPEMTGLDVLKKIREQKNYSAVIFISANHDDNLVVECLNAGADDYLRKPFRFSELIARVEVRFRHKDLNDQLQKANQKLEHLSVTDDLTGLLNMRTIFTRLENELKRAKRYHRQVACIMMDIDHFKAVNDTADHLFGSFVIKELGAIIRNSLRGEDFAARYGGDEFLIVLSEAQKEGAQTFAERLRKKIESHLFTDGKYSIKRTCSLGVSISTPEVEISAKELIRKADVGLYESKNNGRNRTTIV